MILHTLAIAQSDELPAYGTLTVLINADEEISSPGSRSLISKLGAEHDATFSVESSRAESDKLSLATSGIASVTLKVKGRASHSGNAPEQGINALYELAHQVLQTRDLSDPALGLKMNWTLANAGTTRNMIPPGAQAVAGRARAARGRLRRHRKKSARAHQEPAFARRQSRDEFRAPPAAAGSDRRVAALANTRSRFIAELGKKLVVDDVAEGGGTDAAFAALNTKAPVIERFGLQGYGAHSADAEYVLIDSIEPRLYLARAHDHGRVTGQDSAGAVSRIYKLGFD